jgi:hypothetical protein
MNRIKLLIVIGLVLLINGCNDFVMICSLNPFYLDKNVVLLHEIEGNWTAIPLRAKSKAVKNEKSPSVWRQADTTSLWKIEQFVSKESIKTRKGKDSTVFRPMNYYTAKLISSQTDSSTYQFKMVLFSVNNNLYADFMPLGNTHMDKSRFVSESYFSAHTLAKVGLHNKKLVVSWLSEESMKDMIENKRVRVNYTWVKSANRLLIIGSSEQLTEMIDRYAGEQRFIDWENQQAMLTLNRLK